MVTFRLVSGKGEVTHCFLIICRFFLPFMVLFITGVIFAKVSELKLHKIWMVCHWSWLMIPKVLSASRFHLLHLIFLY